MPQLEVDSVRITYGTIAMRQPEDDYITVDMPGTPPPLPDMGKIVMHLKAESSSFDALAVTARRLPFPVDLTLPRRRPKQRRHAHGGLRPMVAAQMRHFTVHETKFSGDTTGAPWTVQMRATRRPSC
jgi:hypothetical protein